MSIEGMRGVPLPDTRIDTSTTQAQVTQATFGYYFTPGHPSVESPALRDATHQFAEDLSHRPPESPIAEFPHQVSIYPDAKMIPNPYLSPEFARAGPPPEVVPSPVPQPFEHAKKPKEPSLRSTGMAPPPTPESVISPQRPDSSSNPRAPPPSPKIPS